MYRCEGLVFKAFGPRILSLEVGPRHGIETHDIVTRTDGAVLTTIKFLEPNYLTRTVTLLQRIGLIKHVESLTKEEILSFKPTSAEAKEIKVSELPKERKCQDCREDLVKRPGRGRWPVKCENCKTGNAGISIIRP